MRTTLLMLAIASLFAAGCRQPGWWGLPPAGPMSQQQQRAVVHDPYPDTDVGMGPNAGQEVRPPQYQQGLPEPVKSRIVPDAMPWALGR